LEIRVQEPSTYGPCTRVYCVPSTRVHGPHWQKASHTGVRK